MVTGIEQSIVDLRQRILNQVEREGALKEILKESQPDVVLLAQLVTKWVDDLHLTYKANGYEVDEWKEDIWAWLLRHQFHIEGGIPAPGDIWALRVSATGNARHLLVKFRLK